jgi:hypothetical protein
MSNLVLILNLLIHINELFYNMKNITLYGRTLNIYKINYLQNNYVIFFYI